MGSHGATAIAKVPCGHSGHRHASSDGPSGSSDTATLLLPTVVPMVTMMAQNITSTMQQPSRRHRRSPSLPPSSPPRDSSLLPAIQNELDVFLQMFGHAKGISDNRITKVEEWLKAAHYTPDALAKVSLLFEHSQKLIKLPEGQVYALRKFSWEWCGKIDAKRAKRKLV